MGNFTKQWTLIWPQKVGKILNGIEQKGEDTITGGRVGLGETAPQVEVGGPQVCLVSKPAQGVSV